MSNSLLCPLLGLERLIADSATFRGAIDVPAGAEHFDQAAAAVQWFTTTADDQAQLYRQPGALLTFGGASSLTLGDGERVLLGTRGNVVLLLSAPAVGRSDREAARAFLQYAGDVLDEIIANAGADYSGETSYWHVQNWEVALEPIRTKAAHRQAGHDYWIIGLQFGHSV